MYIIIPAYEPDKRLIQVVQDITIKLPKACLLYTSGSGYCDRLQDGTGAHVGLYE